MQFCAALMRASATLARRFDGRLGTLHGISLGDFGILHELQRSPDGRMRRVDLAGNLGLTASAVTRALIPLEKIGLVARKPDLNDARVGYAMLTASGKRVLEEAIESAESLAEEIVPAGTTTRQAARLLDDIAQAGRGTR